MRGITVRKPCCGSVEEELGAMELMPGEELDVMETLVPETPALVPPCHKFRQAAAKYLRFYQETGIKKYLCYYYHYLSLYFYCLYNLTQGPKYFAYYKYYRTLYKVCIA